MCLLLFVSLWLQPYTDCVHHVTVMRSTLSVRDEIRGKIRKSLIETEKVAVKGNKSTTFNLDHFQCPHGRIVYIFFSALRDIGH